MYSSGTGVNQTWEGKIETILFVQVKQNEGSNIWKENKAETQNIGRQQKKKQQKCLIEAKWTVKNQECLQSF